MNCTFGSSITDVIPQKYGNIQMAIWFQFSRYSWGEKGSLKIGVMTFMDDPYEKSSSSFFQTCYNVVIIYLITLIFIKYIHKVSTYLFSLVCQLMDTTIDKLLWTFQHWRGYKKHYIYSKVPLNEVKWVLL